jgi:hypothetical protein
VDQALVGRLERQGLGVDVVLLGVLRPVLVAELVGGGGQPAELVQPAGGGLECFGPGRVGRDGLLVLRQLGQAGQVLLAGLGLEVDLQVA